MYEPEPQHLIAPVTEVAHTAPELWDEAYKSTNLPEVEYSNVIAIQ